MNILQISDNLSDSSGVSRVMMNYYLLLKEKINYSFYILNYNESNYGKILKNNNINFYSPNITTSFRNYKKIKENFENFIKNNKFDIVEINCPHFSFLFLNICYKYNIKVRIIHAHSSIFSTSKIKSIIGKILNLNSNKLANCYFSCSDLAANYWFNNNKNVFYIPNFVDKNNYTNLKLDEKNKLKITTGLSDTKKTIGFVGRISKEKNINFLIKLIKKFDLKKYQFLIVGTGPLNDYLKKQLQYEIKNGDVILTGYKENVYDYYQIMDYVVLPSRKEGLPVCILEAQYYGINCYLSNNITRQVNFGLVEYLKLDVDIWHEKICNSVYKKIDKSLIVNNLFFDKEKAMKNIYEIYLKVLEDNHG